MRRLACVTGLRQELRPDPAVHPWDGGSWGSSFTRAVNLACTRTHHLYTLHQRQPYCLVPASATPHRPESREWPAGGRPQPPPPCGWPGTTSLTARAGPPPAWSPACCPRAEACLVQTRPAASSASPSFLPRVSVSHSVLPATSTRSKKGSTQ